MEISDKQRFKLVWNGNYQDITWEVVKWGCGDKDIWNSYIYIVSPALVDKLWSKKKKIYSWGNVYIPKKILEDLPWNGGQTYYHQVIDNGRKHIKIGDDYSHLWDGDQIFTEDYIIVNIKHVIDSLIEQLSMEITNEDLVDKSK